jgi:hypothetical protein
MTSAVLNTGFLEPGTYIHRRQANYNNRLPSSSLPGSKRRHRRKTKKPQRNRAIVKAPKRKRKHHRRRK